MAKYLEIYKCAVCGNIVEVLHAGGGVLECCGDKMALVPENTVDASREKHLPVIERRETETLVKVGSIAHPMDEAHYIEWIELIADGVVYRKRLQPGDAPEAVFPVAGAELTAREYCTLHGQWSAQD